MCPENQRSTVLRRRVFSRELRAVNIVATPVELSEYLVFHREAHQLFEELVFANATDERSDLVTTLAEIPFLIIDDLGMRKLPASAAEDLLEIIMRRYERASTLITSTRPLEDWPKMFSDTPAVTALLDRLMHHGHFLQSRDKSYRLHESSLAARAGKAKSAS
jgi:DNA replication protein DnaC